MLSLRPGSREGAIKNLQLPIVVKVPKKLIMMIEVYKFMAGKGAYTGHIDTYINFNQIRKRWALFSL